MPRASLALPASPTLGPESVLGQQQQGPRWVTDRLAISSGKTCFGGHFAAVDAAVPAAVRTFYETFY